VYPGRADTLPGVDLELRGKAAIVTGGSRGIGKAVARELAGEGANVAIVARDRQALETAAEELARETQATVVPIACDTGSDDAVRVMVAEAVARLGGVDILVNCAAQPGGQAPPPKLAEIDDEVFWPDVNVKVMGYLRCIREVAPHMVQRGGGRIVNISGLAARSTGSTVGSIRNVAVAAMTKNLAEELGPQGISVVVVHPALTRTEKTPGVIRARAEALGLSEEEVEARMAQVNVLHRLIDAGEVAYVVAFLCSPRAIAINGDAVVASGGTPGSIHY
jgi:NAD(P)-dependent dehydrogenase (short-subunit alcohol dehydrogenase family)